MFNVLKKCMIMVLVMGQMLSIVDMCAMKRNRDDFENSNENKIIDKKKKGKPQIKKKKRKVISKFFLNEMVWIYENAIKERNEKIKMQKEFLHNVTLSKEESLSIYRQIFKLEEEKKSIESYLEQLKLKLLIETRDQKIENDWNNEAIDLTNELEHENVQVFANLIDETKNSLSLSIPFKLTESSGNEQLNDLLYQDIETPFGYLQKLLGMIDAKRIGNKLNVVSHIEQLKKMLISKIDIFGFSDALMLPELPDNLNSIKLLPDGTLATLLSNSIIIWDTKNGKMIQKFIWNKWYLTGMKALPNGRLAIGLSDCTVEIWDVKTGKMIQKLTGHTDQICRIKLLPGDRLATGSDDKTVIIWNTKTGKLVHKLNDTYSSCCMKLLPGGRLAIESDDNTVKIWNAKTGKMIHTLTGHTDEIRCMKLLSGDRLATGSDDNMVIIWDIKTGKMIHRLTGHTYHISCMESLPGDRLATRTDDNTVIIWNIKTGKMLYNLPEQVGYKLMVSLSGDRLATKSKYGGAIIWDTKNGAKIHKLIGGKDSSSCMKLLSDDKLAIGFRDGTVRIWDTCTGDMFYQMFGHENDISSMILLPDGRLVTGSFDGMVIIWGTSPTELEKLDVMQLALLVRLQELKKNNEVNVSLHPEWQEVFKSLPEKIQKYFSNMVVFMKQEEKYTENNNLKT